MIAIISSRVGILNGCRTGGSYSIPLILVIEIAFFRRISSRFRVGIIILYLFRAANVHFAPSSSISP